ncbi:MAG: diaminopimelate dehydrogenase [Clostridia bacterium]|nr:diaminopimelate dehydrogenase [Clostridia bacterium]
MIRIGIAGYGNLGRGVEAALGRSSDMTLAGIFSRRGPDTVRPTQPETPVWPLDDAAAHADEIDVLVICSGSAHDLPEQTPALARLFHVVDSFDTHAAIPAHFAAVDAAAAGSGHLALISCGWDPGLFSVLRAYGEAALPDGRGYTFWGPGVSQGHSDALRRISGVVDARQYTIPVEEAVNAVRRGECPPLTPRQRHQRVCYVAVEEGADQARIRREIETMPGYFADYDTTVHFLPRQELLDAHSGLPHGGFVLQTGETADGARHTMEFKLTLASNPAFTGSVLTACARAAFRLAQRGEVGCRTMLDLSPALLSPHTPEELRSGLL